MFVPITSQVNIEPGMVLKEIASGHLYEVRERLKTDSEVSGEVTWEISEIAPGSHAQTALALPYLELAAKYDIQVEDEIE